MEREAFLGRTAEEVWPGAEGRLVHERALRTLASGEPDDYESELDTPRGRFRVVTHLHSLRDGEGRVTSVMGITRLVTGPD